MPPKTNLKTDRVAQIKDKALFQEFLDKSVGELHNGAWYDVLSKEYKPLIFTDKKNKKKLQNYIKGAKKYFDETELNTFNTRLKQYEDMVEQNGMEWAKTTLYQWKRNKTSLGQSSGQIIGKRKAPSRVTDPSQILNVKIRKKKGSGISQEDDDTDMTDPVTMVSAKRGKDDIPKKGEVKKYGNEILM